MQRKPDENFTGGLPAMIEVIETVLLFLFSGLALLASAGFMIFRQPVYAALSFAATVLSAACLYILQDASYLAAATMVIYAGATIIIFLFVLMFAQHSFLQTYEMKYSNLPIALVVSVCLFLVLGYAVSTRNYVRSGITFTPINVTPPVALSAPATGTTQANTTSTTDKTLQSPTSEPARLQSNDNRPLAGGRDMSVAALGKVAYTRYLWALELAGTLLLVAAGGAIVIAQRESDAAQSTGVST